MAIGVALTSFGLEGDIKVEPLTDFPARFDTGRTLYFGDRQRRVQRSRWQGKTVYIKLTGINTPEDVAKLRGHYLELPEQARATPGTGVYFQSDIVGLRVETAAGEPLGRVIEFLPTGANDVLVVHGDRGELLVPMIEDVVINIDLDAGLIAIEPIEGLLPAQPPAPRPVRPIPDKVLRRKPWLARRRPAGCSNVPAE